MILASFARACCVFVVFGCLALVPARGAVSVGILPGDDGARMAADLLTAQLSQAEGVAVLERGDLARVISEQALSLAQPADVLSAGRLAGADAVLFLQQTMSAPTGRERRTGTLSLRLISVRQGILLRVWDFAWPPEDPQGWSERAAAEVRGLLARVNVPAADAVKVSLLNFKSATDSREARLLDQELNGLLLRRLAMEPSVFVLERQKLGATLFERELSGEGNPFWNGSVLVEGAVNKLGFVADEVSVEGRFTSASGETRVVNLQGRRDALGKLVDELAREILKSAAARSTASWDPANEAGRFLEEAQWSLRWGLWEQAQSAADAAWALGSQTDETAVARVQAYARGARPETGATTRDALGREIRFEQPPKPANLRDAISALSIYDAFSRTVEETGDQAKGWEALGLEALGQASEVLFHFFFSADAREGRESDLAELRALCRDVSGWLEARPGVRRPFLEGAEGMSLDESRSALAGENLFRLQARRGALWLERQAEVMAMHRRLVEAPGFPRIRREYFGSGPHVPVIVGGWAWQERSQGWPSWRGLLNELEGSSNAVVRVEAAILRAKTETQPGKLYEGIREVMKRIQENADALASHPVLLEYEYLPGQMFEGVRDASSEAEALRREIPLREQEFRRITSKQWDSESDRRKQAKQSEAEAELAALLPAQKEFLQRAGTDSREFNNLFPRRQVYAEAQARELKALLPAYRGALANVAEGKAPGDAGQAGRMSFWVDRLEQHLAKSLEEQVPPAASNRRPAETQAVPSAPPPAQAGPINRAAPGQVDPAQMRPELHRPPNPNPASRFGGLMVDRRGGPGGVPTRATGARPPAGSNPSGAPAATVPQVAQPRSPVTGGGGPAVMISRDIEPPTNAFKYVGAQSRQLTSIQVEQGRLWARFQSKGGSEAEGYRQRSGGALVRFELGKGSAEVIEMPSTKFEFQQRTPFDVLRPDFQIWEGAVYAAGGAQLQRYHLGQRTWEELPVPIAPKTALYLLNGKLYALTPESLLEIGKDGQSARTIASVRRRPAVSKLDNLVDLTNVALLEGAGGLRIWAEKTLYDLKGESLIRVRDFGRAQAFNAGDSLLVLEDDPRQPHQPVYRVPATGKGELWFTHTLRPGTRPSMRGGMSTEAPLWRGLEGHHVEGRSAVFEGDEFFALVTPPARPGQPMRGSMGPKSLLYLRKGERKPAVLEIGYGAGVPNLFDSRMGQGAPLLVVAGDQLAIGHPNAGGIWLLPMEEIREAAKSNR